MRYTRKVKEETKRAYFGAEYDSPLKDIVQKWTFNNNPYLAGYYGQQSQLSYGQQNQLNYGQQNQLNYGQQNQLNYGQQNQLNYGQPDPVDIAMRQTEHFSKTPCNPDTHILIYETETEEMFFAYILDEGKWKALVKKNISRRNNNLRGGVNNVQVIKDKGIPVCKNITFISAKPFRREDKPRKKYYEIKFVTAKGAFNIVIEKKEFDSSSLCRIAEGVLEEGQEKLCSCLFRIMINQLLENEFEITIPMYAGWYKDDVYGMVYLDKLEYPSLPDNAISTGMRKRIIDPTGFNKDDFLSTLITTIKDEWQLHFILGLRLSSPLLLILERKGIQPRLIIAPIIDTLKQSDVVTALLKTNDLFSLNTVSLNKNEIGCEKEIAGSRDGVAVLSGPRTAAEAKINEKNVRIVRDAAIGANGTENITRCLVTIIGRFLPKCLMPEEYLAVDCLNISTEIDVRVLRAYVLLFDSIYIKYIENNWDKVQGIVERTVENYKAKPDSDVASEYQDLYIALLAVIKVMKECFGIDLFSSENFYQVKKLFADSSQSEISPDHTVKKQFISVARKMIFEGEFRIMDLLSDDEKDGYTAVSASADGKTETVEVIYEFPYEDGWTNCFAGERASGLTAMPSSGAIYGSKVDTITDTGIRRDDYGDYCCAMGVWYGYCNDRFLIELENGTQFTTKICDSKGYADDGEGKYHNFGGSGKCIVEFIYDDGNLPSCVAFSGSWGYYNWNGLDLGANIKSIKKINYGEPVDY